MTKLARLQSIPEDADLAPRTSRRREPRFETWFDATLENAHGDRTDLRIAEVSLHGCRINGDLNWLRTGAFVSISIAGGHTLPAIVRWVRDGSAGMEFLRPVSDECTEWHELMDAPF